MTKINNIPLVSIIVPCYKVERYLKTCIESIIHQTYTNWELILVDDGSPDSSGQICDNYVLTDSRIKVIHKVNGGLSSARNAGLDIVRGAYVTFLDSDDFWHLDYLKVLIELATQNNADIVQCGYVRGVDKVFPKSRRKNKVTVFDNHSIFTRRADRIVMWGKIYKSELFKDIRMPVGLIHEDDWTTWKLYYKANNIIITSIPLYYYTINANSIMGISKKAPDFTYFGAYVERVAFFANKKEFDLEVVSRMQWSKSLLLLYTNKMLTNEQKRMVKEKFDENWNHIQNSKIVPLKLRIIFYAFYNSPRFVSLMLLIFRTFKKQ